MSYCERCGAKLEENARFCHKCGTPVAQVAVYAPPPPAPPATPSQKEPLIVLAVVLICVFVIAVVVIVIFVVPIFSMNFNQTNPGNQNINSISLNFPAALTQASSVSGKIT